MSGQDVHPHVQGIPFTPAPQHPASPIDIDGVLDDQIFGAASQRPTLRDIDIANGVLPPPFPTLPTPQPRMEITEERFRALMELSERQAKQLEDANAFANQAAAQIREAHRQLQASQQNVTDLTAAFNNLSAQPRPLTTSSPPKKKPDLPPFDSKNVLVWIRRVEAAYSRVGVVEPKDKFAWMESIFQVKLDPKIDAFLYSDNNTAEKWAEFVEYLKFQYGPTLKQKTLKLMGDIPRHDLTPSQYLTQLVEESKDVTIDNIRKEHLLKTIPSNIRQILGKEVESMSAADVAKAADSFFDRQGKPLEKSSTPINHVSAAPSTFSTLPPSTLPSSSSAFTAAFDDEDDTDVNFVRRGNGRGNDRGRSRNRGQRSQSRPNQNRFQNASSTGSGSQESKPSSASQPGLCRWHRLFGDKSRKCVTDCPRFKSFSSSQQSGNGQGGRRQ